MAGEEDKLLEAYGAGADPFAMSPPPPESHPGYGYDYPRTMTPLDIARAMVPPGSRPQVPSAKSDDHWRIPSQLELAAMLAGPRVPGKLPPSLIQRLEAVPPAPARELLPYELPMKRDKVGSIDWWEVYSSPHANTNLPPGYPGAPGRVRARHDPSEKAVYISGSELPFDQQGQGIGMAMYQRIVDQAHKLGHTVHSDNTVSAQAQRIYDALGSRGYQVNRHPRVRVESDGTMRVVGPSEPVYSVRPPTDRLPEVAEILRKYVVPPAAATPALVDALAQYGVEPTAP